MSGGASAAGAAPTGARERIRILVVDDHAVLRSGLRLLLDAEPDLEVVGEAGTARQAIYETIQLKPDVVLMDIVMPDQSGLEAVPAVLNAAPGTKVLMLSMQDDPTTSVSRSRPGRAATC